MLITEPTARAVLTALRTLARRHQFLTDQADDLGQQIKDLVREQDPHLLFLYGVGPTTAAQLLITAGGNPDRLRSEASFAALCGTAPVPASSGTTTRHRLSPGGDRAANQALHTIALVRMSSDPRTKIYVRAQREKGLDTAEILRLLKRAVAREIFKSLTRGGLRVARACAALHLGDRRVPVEVPRGWELRAPGHGQVLEASVRFEHVLTVDLHRPMFTSSPLNQRVIRTASKVVSPPMTEPMTPCGPTSSHQFDFSTRDACGNGSGRWPAAAGDGRGL